MSDKTHSGVRDGKTNGEPGSELSDKPGSENGCLELIQTEQLDPNLLDLDQRSNTAILSTLLHSQQYAVDAVAAAQEAIDRAVTAAANCLLDGQGRLILVGAGASGRLAVQDGAEMWPTYGWPDSRLMLSMAGGERALLHSVEGVEDDSSDARSLADDACLTASDVVVAVAASGRSAWTCEWLRAATEAGSVSISMANNAKTPLLDIAQYPIFLNSGPEVLAGSTRMAAGTAQKIALNLFSTTMMIRLNRTYGNLMVDMAAVNNKLDKRRVRLLQGVLPHVSDIAAQHAIDAADGWVKLAVLLASGQTDRQARELLVEHRGSLRLVLAAVQ